MPWRDAARQPAAAGGSAGGFATKAEAPRSPAGCTTPTTQRCQRFLATHRPPSPGASASPTQHDKQPRGPKLVTGTDVLQHFTSQGLDAVPRLVHCVPATAAAAGGVRPASSYDLSVVPRTQLPAAFCTLSATGVVHVPGDSGAASTHTPLGQWLRQASLHTILASLPAGQHLLAGSMLSTWRANARRQRFERRRQQVSRQLLHLKPGVQRVLSESRSRLAQLHALGALQPMDGGAVRLEALVAQSQDYQSTKVAPLLARCVASTVADVEVLALRLQSSERLLQREVCDYVKDPSAGASQGLCPVKVRAERAAMTAKHAAALNDLQRLPCFVRLLSLTLQQAQLELLQQAVSGLKAHLQTPGNALRVDLLLQGAEGVALSPSLEEMLKGLSKGVIEHLVSLLMAAPRLLHHRSIAALVANPQAAVPQAAATASTGTNRLVGASVAGHQAASSGISSSGAGVSSSTVLSGTALVKAAAAAAAASSPWLTDSGEDGTHREGGQLLMMVIGDRDLQGLRRALDSHVMRCYREAQSVAEALSNLAVLQRFACVWEPRAYKARQHSVAGLRRDALLIREWQAQLEAALNGQAVGLLQLETGTLKAALTHTLASARATIAMMMMAAARRAAEAAVDKLQSTARELAQQPGTLPEELLAFEVNSRSALLEFKARVAAISQCREGLLVTLPGHAHDLWSTVTAWGFRLPQTDQGLQEELKEACRGLSAALTAATAFLDSRQLGMVAVVDRQAKDVQLQAQELLQALEAAAMQQCLLTAAAQPDQSEQDSGRAATAAAGSSVSAEVLAAWQQQHQRLAQAAHTLNQQEAALNLKHTQWGHTLEEAHRVLQGLLQHA